MKNKLALALLTVGAIGVSIAPPIFADENLKLEKAAEKNDHKADKEEHKAEVDVTENKVAGAKKHARKAALDEIKAEKEEDLAHGSKDKAATSK